MFVVCDQTVARMQLATYVADYKILFVAIMTSS